MNNYHHRLIPDDRSPLVILLLFIASMMIGYFVAAFLAFVVIVPTVGSISAVQGLLTDPSPSQWWTIMLMQLVTAFTLFVITPYVFIKLVLGTSINYLFTPRASVFSKAFGITVLVTFCFIVVNSLLVEWNSNMVLPEFMSDIENYIRAQEDRLAQLTEILTDIKTFDKYLFAMFVIAVIPAIGEELLFRGVLQTFFEKHMNAHLAILLTAVIFSAFHFQFYGFLPRAALGILFGYLFYYSGNLVYPIIAHFVNNGLTLTLVYLYKTEMIQYDLENSETPSIMIIFLFFLVGLILIALYRRLFVNTSVDE
ncbi:MAG: CPBP family intramembrane glutamic endopeptidase [Cyclobacteriaceae bacterium]